MLDHTAKEVVAELRETRGSDFARCGQENVLAVFPSRDVDVGAGTSKISKGLGLLAMDGNAAKK